MSEPVDAGSYTDPHANGAVIQFQSSTWTADEVTAPFAFDELVASWNATTPDGTWVKIEMQAAGSGRVTKWYTLGIWASGDGTIRRTSVPAQGDGDGLVAIDSFVRAKKAAPLDSYTLRVTLYREQGSAATPTVTLLGAMVSAAASHPGSTFSGDGADLSVPELSQETHVGHYPEYANGGEAWCSPTSTAMVLRFWGRQSTTELAIFPGAGHDDGEVDYAARSVFDHAYDGSGNWPFNTAYAGTRGLSGFVTRLRSLDEAQVFIAQGIPLIASINGRLPGFLFDKTSGHLLVIRGFASGGETAADGGLAEPGDVITNDPAVWTNEEARKIYRRADFESVWLGGSQGIVYVIWDPATKTLPANVGPNPNW